MRTNKSIKEGKGEKIKELRNKGYSYGQINKETGFSKSSISYHAGEGQKEKSLEKQKRQNGGFKRKVWGFIYSSRKPKEPFVHTFTHICKKGRHFFYGDTRKKNSRTNMIIKKPKIWQYFGKVFPGITSKSKHGEVQAVNQWTGKKDYHENGEPIMYPYVRCKLTDEIVDVEDSYIQVEHEDGNSRNNSVENFSFVTRPANAAKGECKGYGETEELMNKILTTIRKYK
tara:strand:+ start:42 stop:725 length:684 start_codon:yes stop_codon:yes gene_type:complete